MNVAMLIAVRVALPRWPAKSGGPPYGGFIEGRPKPFEAK